MQFIGYKLICLNDGFLLVSNDRLEINLPLLSRRCLIS